MRAHPLSALFFKGQSLSNSDNERFASTLTSRRRTTTLTTPKQLFREPHRDLSTAAPTQHTPQRAVVGVFSGPPRYTRLMPLPQSNRPSTIRPTSHGDDDPDPNTMTSNLSRLWSWHVGSMRVTVSVLIIGSPSAAVLHPFTRPPSSPLRVRGLRGISPR
jgi:hypothetical protein